MWIVEYMQSSLSDWHGTERHYNPFSRILRTRTISSSLQHDFLPVHPLLVRVGFAERPCRVQELNGSRFKFCVELFVPGLSLPNLCKLKVSSTGWIKLL